MKILTYILLLISLTTNAQILGDSGPYIQDIAGACTVEVHQIYSAYYTIFKPKKVLSSGVNKYTNKQKLKVIKYLDKASNTYQEKVLASIKDQSFCPSCELAKTDSKNKHFLIVDALNKYIKCTDSNPSGAKFSDSTDKVKVYRNSLLLMDKLDEK